VAIFVLSFDNYCFVFFQTNIEISQDMDFTRILELEEEYIKKICDDIIRMKPDLIITEKGISDLASHYLLKAGITAMRRVKKSDNNRLARACGATIVNRPDEIKESDIGSGCGLFEVKKVLSLCSCNVSKSKLLFLLGISRM